MKVGVVTVLYNSTDVLEGFFSSLSQQVDVTIKLYVIDNSPTDEGFQLSRHLAKQHGIDTTLVYNNGNLGVAKGNNQGIELALADNVDYVVLSNNDIEFSNPAMINGMIADMSLVGARAAVPKMLYYGTRKIWCAGGSISKLRSGSPHRGDLEDDVGQYDVSEFTEYAPTCFMILRRDVFQDVGLMDEDYFVYYDDTDFVWRMNKCNTPILYVPRFELFHKVSFSTGGNESLFSLYYVTRNRLFFARKNLPIPYRWIAVCYTIGAMGIKSFKFDKMQRSRVYKALVDGLKAEFEASTRAR
ncbi:glycosyltransferase family 2 protein [Pigmentiphaga litoralis]|uniref:glycosyltransferase family 2 protein n=1 Tax=Pigmentiphaga litoralis TaxID=516702 RepID=UPI003B42A731